MLHWIVSVILIAATSAFTNISEGISFPANLQQYGAGWIGGMIRFAKSYIYTVLSN
jgi:hypothetical protein